MRLRSGSVSGELGRAHDGAKEDGCQGVEDHFCDPLTHHRNKLLGKVQLHSMLICRDGGLLESLR